MKFKTKIKAHFGIEPDVYRGRAFRRLEQEVDEAAQDDLFVALVGDPLCGKKTVVGSVIRKIIEQNRTGERQHHIIYMQLSADTRVTISQIVAEMIMVLNRVDENEEDSRLRPKRDFYARKRQLTGILGRLVYTNEDKVTLILEQAQHLHGNTIRALKELRELSFLGRNELFGIILTGHPSLRAKIETLDDVRPRIEQLIMKDEATNWLNEQERIEYLKSVWGGVLTGSMRRHIAQMCFTPGAMDAMVYERLKLAYTRGDTELSEKDFLPLKVIYENAGVSMDQIAREARVSKATASLAVNGKYANQDTVAAVKAAIERLTAGKLAKAG